MTQGLVTAAGVGSTTLHATDPTSGALASLGLSVTTGFADTRWVPKYTLPTGMAVSPTTGIVVGSPVAWQYNTTRGATTETLSSSATISDLQTALNNAPKKHTIYVDPTSVFLGTLTTPIRDGTWTMDDSTYIETTGIRSAVSDGFRIGSAQFTTAGSAMAQIQSVNSGDYLVISGGAGAGYVRFVGIEFGYTAGINTGTVNKCSVVISSDTDTCVIVDRCYFGRNPVWNTGIFFPSYGSYCGLVDSHIENVQSGGSADTSWRESKCFYFNGSSGFVVRNNYLDAAIINGMIGAGQYTPVGIFATDVLIEWNHFTKQSAYYGKGMKNLFEVKHGARVLVRYNWFEHNTADGQDGIAISFKSSWWSGGGGNAATGHDIHFVFNWIDDVVIPVKISGAPDGAVDNPAYRIEVGYNLGTRLATGPVSSLASAPAMAFELLPSDSATPGNPSHNWSLHHNTWVNAGTSGATNLQSASMDQSSGALVGFTIEDTVVGHGEYGFKLSGYAEGNASFAQWAPYSAQRMAIIATNGAWDYSGSYANTSGASGTTAGVMEVAYSDGYAATLASYTDGNPLTNNFRVKSSLASTTPWQDANGYPIGPDMGVLELVRDYHTGPAVPAGY